MSHTRPTTHVWSTHVITIRRCELQRAHRLRDSIRTEVAIRQIEQLR